MKTSRILILGLLTGGALLAPGLAQAATTPGMVNSPHDFTVSTNLWVNGVTNWVPNNSVCEECHTVHKADAAYKNAGPLWAHNMSGNTYTPFTSPTLKADGYANGGTPGWSSLACLSCHDGSVAINSLNGSVASTPVNLPNGTTFQIAVGGTDLSGTHPIGIDYNVVQPVDGYLNASSTIVQNAGADSGVKTIQQELLFNETGTGGGSGMIECASCHDIHQQMGVSGTSPTGTTMKYRDALKIGGINPFNGNSSSQALCLTCHIK